MGFWKKLGKIASIAAPIVAAPFTGGTSLALLGAGAGAANAALSGGGVKGALLGAGLGAIPGVGKIAGKAIGGKVGSLISGLTRGGGASGGAGGNFLQSLLNGDTLNSIGQGLGAIGKTEAHNRGVQLDAMMAADQQQILADQDRRAAESDIVKKAQIANYIKSGGFQDQGPGVSANGKAFTKFDFGTRPTSESEIAMATELEKQIMDRLHNPRKLRDYDSKMEPGKMETFLNWASPITTSLGVARGSGRYQLPQTAQTQLPQPEANVAFNPAPVNPASGNPWSRVQFTTDKLLG